MYFFWKKISKKYLKRTLAVLSKCTKKIEPTDLKSRVFKKKYVFTFLMKPETLTLNLKEKINLIFH